MELKGKTKMKHTLFLLIFTYATVLNAQRCLCGMDSLSYVQGYIDGKFKNNYQVFLRSEDKLVTTPGNYSLREYFTLVIPRGPYFLLLFKNHFFAPEDITTPEEFSKLDIDKWTVNDSSITLTPKEKAVLYLALKEVPVNKIFVTKEEYFNSYFFQALSVNYIVDERIKTKNRKGEENVIAFYNQLGHYVYRVKFSTIYKRKIIADLKTYIKRKLKKNEGVIDEL
jgi:hypothetical protein